MTEELKTYGTATVFLEEGEYSVDELIEALQEYKERTGEALAESMVPIGTERKKNGNDA